MGCLVTLLRILIGPVLGLAVLGGLLYFLVFANFSERLVTAETYYAAINETDAYNRVYDEVLVDEAIREQTRNLLGGVELKSHEETVELLRGIMPPAYLQEQTENNIDRFTRYMRHETNDLEIYADLREPLERVESVVEAKVYRFIDELEIAESTETGCSADTLRQLAADYAVPAARLSTGKLPESVPSLESLTRECRERGFDRWFDQILFDTALNSQASLLLRETRGKLRQSFIEGDSRAFLKAVAASLIEPLTDAAIADIRRELQPGDRLELIEKITEWSKDLTKGDIESQAGDLRELVTAANGPAKYIALAVVVISSLLLALVYLPSPSGMLRWPGISLVIGGGVCLIVGFVLNSAIPGQLNSAITYSASYSSDVPASAVNLAGDLLESFGRQATGGFIPSATVVILLGVALVAASFLSGALFASLRKILPSGNR